MEAFSFPPCSVRQAFPFFSTGKMLPPLPSSVRRILQPLWCEHRGDPVVSLPQRSILKEAILGPTAGLTGYPSLEPTPFCGSGRDQVGEPRLVGEARQLASPR